MHEFGRVLGRLAAVVAVISLIGLVPLSSDQPAFASGSMSTPGYWMVTDNGGVMSFGGVNLFGTAAGSVHGKVVDTAATADGNGYWMAASDGGVFTFGNAQFYGSAGGVRLNQPIAGMAPTPSGRGYWLVASDGGIFTYGDAQFYGSTGGIRLNQPIVAMAPTPSGHGYWLVARDGGIFTFGDAQFYGSTGGIRLNQPITGMAATNDGAGYWLVASDGGIFTFGNAPFMGSTGGVKLNRPIVSMTKTENGGGYWLVGSDGGIFTFGNAPFRGSGGGTPLLHPVKRMIIGPGTGSGVVAGGSQGIGPYPSGASGFDISWPQCAKPYPPANPQIGVIGTTNGVAFSTNPCLVSQVAWAGAQHNLYTMLNSPNGATYNEGANGPKGACAAGDGLCWSYNYGWNAAAYSVAGVDGAGVPASQWWLDVETKKIWSTDKAANTEVVRGAIDMLHSRGISVGLYSTSYQWGVITGGANFGLPTWVATGAGFLANPAVNCTMSKSFNNGPPWMIQYGNLGFDADYAC